VWREVARDQCGVLTRAQAIAAGVTRSGIAANLRARRWQRVYDGVYATFSGPLPRRSRLWAATLRAGPAAMLSHDSAAELVGLCDRPAGLVHVTVPVNQRVARIPGVVVHRSRHAGRILHPTRLPPQTRVEETVLDLTQSSCRLEDAIGWLARAVGGRLTTTERLIASMRERRRLRWRRLLESALDDIGSGCHSVLELLYLRAVERAHGLPTGERQARRQRRSGRAYDDVWYRAFRTRVELDGRAAHPEHERWRDMRRDNDAVAAGDRPLRFGPGDVHERPCVVAAQVARVLIQAGWTGRPRRCRRPDCAISSATRSI
jgi:very-short-patch-repair endonuclease